MSSSIYDIAAWANSTRYKKNDIVSVNGVYWYALQDHTSGSTTYFVQDNIYHNFWDGISQDLITGEDKPNFFWTPSYQSSLNQTPRVKKIQFGDSYSQRVRDSISNSLIKIDLTFDNRDLDETTAISHFLETRLGTESFLFTCPKPHNKKKRFIAPSWSVVPVFYDNYTIKVSLEEVVN